MRARKPPAPVLNRFAFPKGGIAQAARTIAQLVRGWSLDEERECAWIVTVHRDGATWRVVVTHGGALARMTCPTRRLAEVLAQQLRRELEKPTEPKPPRGRA
jgi:hypothetical protein